MSENQGKPNNLIDTTDCLEAIGVFRGWKNLLFAIILLCMLLLQGSFWLVNTGFVKTEDAGKDLTRVVTTEEPAVVSDTNSPDAIKAETTATVVKDDGTEKIQEAAKQVVAEPNQSVSVEAKTPEPQPQKKVFNFRIESSQLAQIVRFINFVLIPAAILYCLTMLFSLKVSLLGRLGGINHIARAFFLSLLFLVLLLPWQVIFPGLFAGVMYTPYQLLKSAAPSDTHGIFTIAFLYLRFTGYWLIVLLVLIFAQLRSIRWTKAILRRLEVI